MSRLAFLSPELAAPEVRLASPHPAVVPLGKLDVRGDLDAIALHPGEELVRATPRRGLLLTAASAVATSERLRAAGLRVYDLTGALAAVEVEGARTMRRLTDLDLGQLPAYGPVARGVGAVVQRLSGETFRVLVPQELARYVAEVIGDLTNEMET
jgi:sarcosine oxidase gamma subunit